jgi:hypothetical protein
MTLICGIDPGELTPFQHLQPAARVQFGQGVIHVSPCEGGPFPSTFPEVETG